MAQQTFTIGAETTFTATLVQWSFSSPDRPSIDAALLAGAGPAFFALLNIGRTVAASNVLRTASSQAEQSGTAGPDLSSAVEDGAASITITAGSLSLTLAGPNHSGNIVDDALEPYVWRGGVGEDTLRSDFATSYLALDATTKAGTTLTFRDFEPVSPSWDDNTGDAISGTVGTAISSVTVPEVDDGNPTPTYAAVGALPAGVSFNTTTRVLSFDEDDIEAGSSTITIRATNSAGNADWTVAYSISLPDADAPSASISGDSAVDEGVALSLSVTTTGGLYDSLAYSWSDGGAGGTFSAQTATPSYTLSSVTSNTSVVIACTVTASGTGTNAKSGTSDSVSVGHGVTVRNVPVLTSDTDSIWRLDDRDTSPSTPTGGTTTETHTPTGWTRTEPSPSETQAVWRSTRTRNFSDGSFTSAGAWQSPTRTADELLSLNDIIISDGRRLVDTGSLITVPTDGDVFDSDATVEDGDDPPSLGSSDLTATRIYLTGRTQLRISDSGSGDIEAIFSAGGSQEDYQIHIQTSFDASSVVSLGSDDIDATRSTAARIILGADTDPDGVLDDVDALASGDRVLFFLTEPDTTPAEPLEGSTETGAPSTSGDLGTTNEASLGGSIETGVPSISGALSRMLPDTMFMGGTDTGAPTVSGDLTTTTEAGLAGSIETGAPNTSGDLSTTTQAGFSGSLETGVPTTSGDLGATNEAPVEGSVETGGPTTSGSLSRSVAAMFGGDVGTGAPRTSGDLSTTTQAGFVGSVGTGVPSTSGDLSRSIEAAFSGSVSSGVPSTSGDLGTTTEATLAGSTSTGAPTTSGDLGTAVSASLSGLVDSGVPDVSGDLSITDRVLLLSDWSAPEGETALVHGLWQAGGSGAALYRSAANGGAQGSFLEGDRELQDGQSIERIRESGALRFNDQPSDLDLEAFFTTGPASNGTIYLTTIYGEWSAVVSDVLASSGNHGNNVSFDVTGDFLTALQGIGTGDRFLLAITTSSAPLDGSVDTGAPSTSGSLTNTAELAGSVETGAPDTSGNLSRTHTESLQGHLSTGAASASGDMGSLNESPLDGSLETGVPGTSGDLSTTTEASLGGSVDTGAPTTSGDLSRSLLSTFEGSIGAGPPQASGDLSTTNEASLEGSVGTGSPTASGSLSRSLDSSLVGSVNTGAPSTSGDLSKSTTSGLAGSVETGAPTTTGDLSRDVQGGFAGSIGTGAPSLSGDLGQSNTASLEGSIGTGSPTVSGSIVQTTEASLAGSVSTGAPSTSGDTGSENAATLVGLAEAGAAVTSGDLTRTPGLNIYGNADTGAATSSGTISFTAPDVEVSPLELYEADPPKSIDIVEFLPQKYRDVQVWQDYAQVVQSEIVEDVQDSVSRLLKITDPDEVDNDILPRMLKTLGFYLDISTLSGDDSLRRTIKSLPYFYQKSGTSFFTNILDVFANTQLSLIPLYTNKDAPTFSLGTGNGSNRTFSGTLDETPVVEGTVSINVGGTSVDIDDDGDGDLSGTDGSGTINYSTGAISITLTSAPSSSQAVTVEYDTNAYQTFITGVPDGESLTHDGGNYYLTNHVDLEVLTRIDLSNEEITTLFYYIAPAVLVLNSLSTPIQLDNASLHVGAAFAISIGI